ncbi:MAG: FAD:protein FMN transferase [Agathobaculum sp.]|jgi:thiamine biosynthesis lipoprotein|uniref:FAD:protein FMN transferase n=1 Tax=Agathobaculum sp. TaxID=2048138 RepID=UPI003D9264F7
MKRFLAALLPLLMLCGCVSRQYSTDIFAMDTFMTLTVAGDRAQGLIAECEKEINTLEQALSRTREDSEIWALNHAEGAAAEVPAARELLLSAIEYAELTDGLYDPTVAPLSELWNIGKEEACVPEQAEIDAALETVGFNNLTQLGEDTFGLLNGAQLDLGGIAKGYAADRCAALLQEAGASGLLMLGGNIYAVGTNDGKNWVIGIADPANPSDYIATVEVQNLSVVTSGDYERYFEQDGKRYHHIFDPRTGYPADSGLRSVTVIDENSTRADALTTALFVMGLEDGMAFCEENEVAAVFITAQNEVHVSEQVSEICTFDFVGEKKGYTYAQ